MNTSRATAAAIYPDDEVLRSLLEVYLSLQSLVTKSDSPIYSAAEEAGRILRKNGVSFAEAEDGGTNVSREIE